MRTDVIVLTGVDPDAMAATMVGLQFDLPGAVAVQHSIDVDRSVLTRLVSDMTGIVEHVQIDLEHACVSCAIREDIVPTLERLARADRWQTIISQLPLGAEAQQVCTVIGRETRLARHLRISAVVTSVDGETAVEDLLGDDLLVERGTHSSADDRRGVGEVAAALVEYADLVVASGTTPTAAVELLQALARPQVPVVAGIEHLDAATFATRLHHHERSAGWTSPLRSGELPPPAWRHVWRLELTSPQPFHPGRLLDDIEQLGGGRHRSRGCFWLPTRPDRVAAWDGAGGQLSIGSGESWGRRMPETRLLFTGTGVPPARLTEAFGSMLLSPDEAATGGSWRHAEDGFEPWLGPIKRVA